ncbi:hypothetical protein BpHYR1_040048 [Brachionus plicatilis]|uniref:Uncharacterized protein n=1 Tax=Brachionus plicatilis TaxID=10195 RepID=A0A3M7QV55_BRAPC|nr:hypothetical protein BpHYR1_040048 [Brachionus plicatilis]
MPNTKINRKLYEFLSGFTTVFPRSILQPQNPKHNFDAGNKYHLAHVKTFLNYTACVKVVFRVLAHVEKKYGLPRLFTTIV